MATLRVFRGLLSNGPLVRLLGGEFVSSIGDWLYLVALLIVVYEGSGADAVLLGIVGAARVLPYVLLSFPAGIVADRFDRRLVLLVTDVARGLIMLVMAWLVAVDGPLWAVVVLAVTATCFSCFFGPAIGSYLPMIVRDERELGPANSAWSTLDNLAFVIGPAVAGLLIAASGLSLAFLLNAVSFGIIAVVLWQLPSRPQAAGPEPAPGEAAAAAPGGDHAVEAPTDARAPGTLGELRPVALPLAGLTLVDVVAGFVFGGLAVHDRHDRRRPPRRRRGGDRVPQRSDRRGRGPRRGRVGRLRRPAGPARASPHRRRRAAAGAIALGLTGIARPRTRRHRRLRGGQHADRDREHDDPPARHPRRRERAGSWG